MVTDKLLETISKISSEMSSHNDHSHAQKAEELNSKLTAGQLTIALCGHFSAGKSTLLNTLCGAKLLPSSPIPTSANVVTIGYGDESLAYVEVSTNDGVRYDEVAVDQLDAYCRDGETYISVKIQYPSPLLKQGVVILDTPGIDSTDAAHKLATESALHMADVVFYVMDYNHVQSEINFTFAKELREWGKPLYFIVNQIDKHREEELSFESYKGSVADSFQAWHLEPAGILYLTLRDPNHPHHQWDSLIQLIEDLRSIQPKLTSYSVWSSISYVARSYVEEREQASEPMKQQLLQAMGGAENLERIQDQLQQTEKEISKLSERSEQFPIQLRLEIEQLLDNANIIPAALRDLAHLFLEGQKPGFRAGLFASKQKTAAAQSERLQAFYLEMVKLSEANIAWHLQSLLREAGEKIGFDRNELPTLLLQLDEAKPKEQHFIETINSGAVFGNEYTMTYCKDLSAVIKANYRRYALHIVEELSRCYRAQLQGQIEKLQAEQQSHSQDFAHVEQYRELAQQESSYRAYIEQMLLPKHVAPDLPKPRKLDQNSAKNISFVEEKEIINLSLLSSSQGEHRTSASSQSDNMNQEQLISKLQETAQHLDDIEGMEQQVSAIRQKVERLSQRNYSISLFGAFSAGKSSLANALIGERVLPVSPNPTTAAINSLLPPDGEHPHDTATIDMKSPELMQSDIVYSLMLLGYDLNEQQKQDIAVLFKLIDSITPESIHSGGRAHYSFIKAARDGWQEQREWLGKQRHVDRSLYQAYVAEEQRSCFVSEIKFYYDCELTRKGIILVDTPGADSVNARHTGVAFNYIKSTDAILFVTYYNHAFSHADSQFLDQLGRVKDQFELDKMFFIVNAADLAADEKELLGVMEHVEQNLQRHGIISPRMFPVSSLLAVEGKQANDESLVQSSGLASFEASFYSFIHDELGALAMQSALQEQKHAVSMVAALLDSAKTAKHNAASGIQFIQNSLASLLELKETEQSHPLPQSVKQEMEELLYYIVQRLTFRFGDFYNYAFNPAVLKDDGRSISQATWTAWLELKRSLALELQQELLATTLRVERAMSKSIQKQLAHLYEYAEKQLEGYSRSINPSLQTLSPEQPVDWQLIDMNQKWFSGKIKSPKQFFEGDGKAKLRKTLEELIFPSVELWMKDVLSAWNKHYEQQWASLLKEQVGQTCHSIEQYGKQQLRLLQDESYVTKLEAVYDAIHVQPINH